MRESIPRGGFLWAKVGWRRWSGVRAVLGMVAWAPFAAMAAENAAEPSPGAPSWNVASLVGDWKLVAWVDVREAVRELPTEARGDAQTSVQVWHFLPSGRFRQTVGDDFSTGGGWSLADTTPCPAPLLAHRSSLVCGWVALENVTMAQIPDVVREREWILVAVDGDERLVFYIGKDAVFPAKVVGGRYVRGPAEGMSR